MHYRVGITRALPIVSFHTKDFCNASTLDEEEQSIQSHRKMSSKSVEKLDSITTHPSHVCEIDVTFPTDLQAEQALRILQVDREPTDRVSKTFELVKEEETVDSEGKSTNFICKLRV